MFAFTGCIYFFFSSPLPNYNKAERQWMDQMKTFKRLFSPLVLTE